MHHLIFDQSDEYSIAILTKKESLRKQEMEMYYVDPLNQKGIGRDDIIGFSLEYNPKGKAPMKIITAYLDKLLPALNGLGVHTLMVADSNYFKKLTGVRKSDPHHGYILSCVIKGFEHMSVVLSINHSALFYNPNLKTKLAMSVETVANHVLGTHKNLGTGIIHSAAYPDTLASIRQALSDLHQYPQLTCDIEAFSLKHYDAGIGTIAFAWDEHNGVAFSVDYRKTVADTSLGFNCPNREIKDLLREFFLSYKGELIFHNANYDVKVLIYNLFMHSLLDQWGILEGLRVFNNIECTKVVTYLATNNCAGNKLSLKEQAHEFAGNYAQDDIHDIRKIEESDLLKYNLIDCLSTWYVYKKHRPKMIKDNQLHVHDDLFIPSMKDIVQMELTGMPMKMSKVKEAELIMIADRDQHISAIEANPLVAEFGRYKRTLRLILDNKKLKTKVRTLEELSDVAFIPTSNKDVSEILYSMLGYEPIDLTAGKEPAVGAKTLKQLIHVAKNQDEIDLLNSLIGLGEVSIILNTFIKAFLLAVPGGDGIHYLFGNFNLGGTVSGRLSSSGPNLQNLPSSGNKYAKLVKQCFLAPEGWIWVGADFASLEDRISALTTGDPMKLKVYTDGYDGHCLRAFKYFPERCIGIVDTVESINSIKTIYDDVRQDSKAPTFLLTYGGTYIGLMQNVGLSMDMAKAIEANYHSMYKVSDDWVAAKVKQASVDGYITVAFGLRVRTPILAQTILGTRVTPYLAQKEGRTAGNALGQSYCLLNNRALTEFMHKVRDSKYRLDIRPCAAIHDANYFLIRDDIEIVKWVNDNLIEAMEWQELPDIKHDKVKLGGELDLFFKDWSTSITLPNYLSEEGIRAHTEKELAKWKEKR